MLLVHIFEEGEVLLHVFHVGLGDGALPLHLLDLLDDLLLLFSKHFVEISLGD